MESFIKNALNNHLIVNNLLTEEQFGFVPGRSTVTQLLVTVQEWMFNLDNNIPTDSVYLDFSKAFDSVPHKRLINKLKGYGVQGQIINWIKSFLTDRKQFVKINDISSNYRSVTSGVPQGSVLGPTLFIYFINDLPERTKTSTKIFADDTKCYTGVIGENDHHNLQSSIDEMFDWTEKWLLKFNESKCKILHIGKNNPNYTYEIGKLNDKTTLEKCDLEKDLGVFIDSHLNFNKHVKEIAKNATFIGYKIFKKFTYREDNIYTNTPI